MQAQVTCLPDNKVISVSEQESILKATLAAGIPHMHVCGGKAQCSTCRIEILEGLENIYPRNAYEQVLAQKLHLPDTIRLACQTFVRGNVLMRRPIIDAIDRQIVETQVLSENSMGEEKNLAILFSDIVAYTPFAEAVSPYDTIHVLNRYFRMMGEVIQQHHGQISDYVGDGIMALFGVSNSSMVVEDAVKSALEMFKVLPELNEYLQQMFNRQFQIRIGIHYGKVVIGHVGIDAMSKLAAVGDAVNMASRIENKNKELGTSFLVSEDAYRQVRHFVQPEKEYTIEIKGKKGSYKVYEINPFSYIKPSTSSAVIYANEDCIAS
jgi:adenylate cyclase